MEFRHELNDVNMFDLRPRLSRGQGVKKHFIFISGVILKESSPRIQDP